MKIQMDDQILRFVYIEAMRDATLQKAYNNKDKQWLKTNEIYKKVEKDIKKLVCNVINGDFKEQSEYDKSFYKVIKNINEKINDERGDNRKFSFGNTQKLLNIILKHFYICSYNNAEVKSGFKFCHCPMDRQMMEELWKHRKDLNINKTKDEFVISWGALDYDNNYNIPEEYTEFQSAIRKMIEEDKRVDNNISPIEYDYYIWSQMK